MTQASGGNGWSRSLPSLLRHIEEWADHGQNGWHFSTGLRRNGPDAWANGWHFSTGLRRGGGPDGHLAQTSGRTGDTFLPASGARGHVSVLPRTIYSVLKKKSCNTWHLRKSTPKRYIYILRALFLKSQVLQQKVAIGRKEFSIFFKIYINKYILKLLIRGRDTDFCEFMSHDNYCVMSSIFLDPSLTPKLGFKQLIFLSPCLTQVSQKIWCHVINI